MRSVKTGLLVPCFLAMCMNLMAASASDLLARGYAAMPAPQEVRLGPADFEFGPEWRVELGSGVLPGDAAAQSLQDDLLSRFHVTLGASGARKVIRLSIRSGSVKPGPAVGKDKAEVAEQAYRLELAQSAITVEANAGAGLFYGVQTLLQLLKPRDGKLWLPEAEIADWPDLGLRHIYWDDAHHLERLDDLKRAIRQAAFFKINGFAIKLEGHFQFRSAPAVVEPYALTPAEFQELTDYGLHYYVQVVPYLDGPAHIGFILKHPEYAGLRAFPDSNYEMCVTNPDSYKLLEGMFQDLIDANKGGKYFYLSTDEPYYLGMADNSQCQEARHAKELGSPGKLFAEFAAKAGTYLHDRGRTVFFWGEYPMKPADVPSLPSFLVNGETYGPSFDPLFRERGLRQMIYTSSEGEEQLFPDYFILPAARRLHADYSGTPRIAENFDKISFDTARRDSDLIGEVNAGWADMGLHPETFWLGYAASASAGWHPGVPDPRESMSVFYPLFYGPGASAMDRAYQLLSEQAQFWSDSWERTPSTSRKPIWGNSEGIFSPPQPAHDQTLPLPPAPSDDLSYGSSWSRENARRLELTGEAVAGNDALIGILNANLLSARFNHYNLEVLLAIARICGQNLNMLQAIGRIDRNLREADEKKLKDPGDAVAAVDRALEEAQGILLERNQVFQEAETTWYKSWLPRVASANGRTFLHELDDVKDHLPDRTVDMSYLIYRQLLLPFGDWVNQITQARNRFAAAHGIAAKSGDFDWTHYRAVRSVVR
ncbi:MAG TPA: beta-N-acetylhexosaminidase [Bryobacteraceae bacterium]|nr:beta-N-acetylhexosaminidase [Bryobacteraceae bacterium]